MNTIKEQETTFTLVTPSDETITLVMSYEVRTTYKLKVTREELKEVDFEMDELHHSPKWVVTDTEFVEHSHSGIEPDGNSDSEEIFKRWQEEWEEEQV